MNYNLFSQMKTEGEPMPSITPPNNNEILGKTIPHGILQKYSNPMLQKVDKSFEGFWFQDNPEENYGYRFIPPDPIGAAGQNLLIAVVNSMIEARDKGGKLKWRAGLRDFFASLYPGSFQGPGELPFDPKIVYDKYKNRFVVVSLEQDDEYYGASANVSRILLAVSKSANPKNAKDWHFQAIDAIQTININLPPATPIDFWADYPGLEVDEEAIYITANLFSFLTLIPPYYYQFYGGSRLWIADKSFYNGGTSTVNVFDPYASGGIATTTMPAQIHGKGGAGTGVGTYLVSYSGLSDGIDEYVQVIRVDDPLGTPTFDQEYIDIGDIEGPFPGLPDAPQAGSSYGIEVNDRRALDAVWRNGYLWMTMTIDPNSGADAGQTTAHWVELNTSVPGATTLIDQGDIGGEDIATDTYTFFPSVAVNRDGTAKFGFSASASTIYAGAYVTGRKTSDAPGTVRASEIVHEGEAPYLRTFGGPLNRWGDYSGISIDPTNDDFAWAFNEYAAEPGSPTGDEDGRWGTAWARCKFTGMAKPAVIAVSAPLTFSLSQNYPNPFNPTTTIKFELPSTSVVSLNIYNSLGQLVKTLISGNLEAGDHSYVWDGTNQYGTKVSSGIYLYKIIADNYVQSKKMILMK